MINIKSSQICILKPPTIQQTNLQNVYSNQDNYQKIQEKWKFVNMNLFDINQKQQQILVGLVNTTHTNQHIKPFHVEQFESFCTS